MNLNPAPELAPQLKQLRLSGIFDSLEARNRQAIEDRPRRREVVSAQRGFEMFRRQLRQHLLLGSRENLREKRIAKPSAHPPLQLVVVLTARQISYIIGILRRQSPLDREAHQSGVDFPTAFRVTEGAIAPQQSSVEIPEREESRPGMALDELRAGGHGVGQQRGGVRFSEHRSVLVHALR